jgi:transposase
MALQLPDARHLSDEVLEALRLRAVAAHEGGYTEDTLAAILGVRQETVSRWCCAFRSHGIDGLPHERSGRPTGSGRWLSEEQQLQLQTYLQQHTPVELGIASTLWTREALRELIAHSFGIRLPIRTVGLYLQRWGWTPQ